MRLSKTAHLTLGFWLPIALATTIIMGYVYMAMQQNYRQSADDPQLQVARDGVTDLAQVPDLTQLQQAPVFQIRNDISKLSNYFMVIYDDQKKPVAGNGYLNDQLPTPPNSAFTKASQKSENRFSWSPQKNLRFAAVLKPFKGTQSGYILVARNLNETDNRVKMLTIGTAIAWALALIVSYLWSIMLARWVVRSFSSHDHTHEQHHTT